MTPHEIRKLAVYSFTDPRTVVRVYEGKPTKDLTRNRVVEAAKKLKLPAPPEEKTR